MIRKEESLEYHSGKKAGKIEIKPTKPCLSPREMRMAYLPGAAYPSLEISQNSANAFNYTNRGNLVGVVTNGSSVPGLGNIGALAAKPMLEGMAVLFKRLADIDVYDLELDTNDPDKFIETIKLLLPTFGAINLKDIKAPEGLYIYDKLRNELNIPVFHENLYGTAIVAIAALINALELVNKNIEDVKIVLCGAGTVGIGCARLLKKLGAKPDNLFIYDIKGLLTPDRHDLFEHQIEFVNNSDSKDLEAGMKGADVFIGASSGNILTTEMILTMNRFPIVFPLATPEPEISYEEAKSCRQDIIVATGLGQNPNAVLDILSFPYILRGALDVQATSITEEMMLAASRALAELAREEILEEVERAYGYEHFSFGPEYLLPKPVDPRILVWESAAVADMAVKQNIAQKEIVKENYQKNLTIRHGTGRDTMRQLLLRTPQQNLKVVFTEGTNETILRASRVLMDENIAQPILLGNEEEIYKLAEKIDLDLGGVQVADPHHSIHYETYVEEFFKMRQRNGVTRQAAAERILNKDHFASMMLHCGDTDMMIAGLSTHYSDTLRTILEIIGTAPGISRIASHYLMLLPKDAVLLADCAVNINPNAEELAEIALLTANMSKTLGIEPKVAMLSFSNFGSVIHPSVKKIKRATEIAKSKNPELIIDGEMQMVTARDAATRKKYFPFTKLDSDANVLIFPDLQSANLAMHSLQCLGEAVAIGPVLLGTRLPAHLLQYNATVEEVVNLTTIAMVEAVARKKANKN
ncbi:MAG: NADP-dependent malic enzyme [Melioribacteraceae bacterium]|nr:NADP-dependent malic enzyme [Melioribacteraceae bacterium]